MLSIHQARVVLAEVIVIRNAKGSQRKAVRKQKSKVGI
jgi:hypothetical protein